MDAGAGRTSYNWSSGESTQRLVVSDAGNYSVTITDSNGCTAADSLEISLLQAPSVDLGEDIEACETEIPIVLDAGPDMTSYTWSPSGNGQILEVNNSGSYSVQVENSDGCTATDEINISIFPAPNPDFGLDRIEVCEDETPIVLNPNVSEDYYFMWSTGEDTESITVDNSGTYSVTVSYGACSAEDEVTLTVQSLPMAFDLVGGGQIDPGSESEILLSGSEPGVQYVLFHDMQGEVARVSGTGDQVSFGKFSEPGTYNAEAISDIANCEADMNGSVEIILTNINPAVAGQIKLYPNPVNHILTIDSRINIVQTKIYDSSGKTVGAYEANPEEINFSQLADGVYFIELQTVQGTYRQRIVKTD